MKPILSVLIVFVISYAVYASLIAIFFAVQSDHITEEELDITNKCAKEMINPIPFIVIFILTLPFFLCR